MPEAIPKGSFHLNPSIRLIPGAGDDAPGKGAGVVFQSSPMRALKMNPAAFKLLEQCRSGFRYSVYTGPEPEKYAAGTLPFLDSLCQANILEWRPSEQAEQPTVSVVIPVYNRADDLRACLESLQNLDYPESLLEIVVVDDGSSDKSAEVAKEFGANVIVQPRNRGQSAARNRGVQEASGQIVAFIDSDCAASPSWLKELTPYFEDRRFALVAGYVDSYYRKTPLDRYESVKSALNMGNQKVIGAGQKSVFYAPTCNMLIRRDVFFENGGLDETIRVGEDVEFCWRLMKAGHRMIYTPEGTVFHKHRNDFFPCFKRRFDYGTSEPVLYGKYPDTVKRYPWQSGGMAFFLLCLIGLAAFSPVPFALAFLLLFFEAWHKKSGLEKKFHANFDYGTILYGTARSHFLFVYDLTAHITRYYFTPLLVATLFFWKIAPLTLSMILFPALTDYFRKKPRLNAPMFIFFYWAEQAFYQAGAFWGCLKAGSFRLYRISFVYAGFLKTENPIRAWLKNAIFNRR